MVAGIVAVLACMYWAFVPPLLPKAPTAEVAQIQLSQPEPPAPKDSPIDVTAFASAKLWNPVPPPPTDIVQVAKDEPKPLRLQLIGIIQESGVYKAAIYDQDDDRLFIVTSGQQIKQNAVTLITAKSVEVSDGEEVHTLQLQEAGS